MSFNLQWTRDGVDIPGAIQNTYVVQAADKGHTIFFRAVATGPGGSTAATSPGVVIPADTPALTIAGTPPSSALVGSPYNFTPTAAGGTPPYAFSMPSGSLPNGLSFSTSTGAITGTPTTAQVKTGLVIRVTDSKGANASLPSFSITVAASGTSVTPSTYLATLLASAPGTILTMQPGTYSIDLSGINKAAPGVLLQGQSGVNAAFIGLQNSSGIGISTVDITSLRTGQYGVYLQGCDRVTISNTTQAGNNPGSVHNGSGFFIRSCTNTTIIGNSIQNIGTGIGALDCTSLTIGSNHIDKFSSNGIFYASIHNAVIEKNYIGVLDFLTPGDHPDGIQGASTGSTGRSSNVVVRWNNLDAGSGEAYQGSGEYESHDNITVSGNSNFLVAANGIFFSDCTNATATNNFVQGVTTAPRVYCRNGCNIVSMTNNFSQALPFSLHQPPEPDSTNVSISGNTIIPAASSITDTARRNAFLAANPQIPVS